MNIPDRIKGEMPIKENAGPDFISNAKDQVK